MAQLAFRNALGRIGINGPTCTTWQKFGKIELLLLLGELRGSLFVVGHNVEIPCKQDLEISDSRKVCRKLCRDYVSTGELCKGKTITTVCVLQEFPSQGKMSKHCKPVSLYQTTEGKWGLETDKATAMMCKRSDEETTVHTTKMLLIKFRLWEQFADVDMLVRVCM